MNAYTHKTIGKTLLTCLAAGGLGLGGQALASPGQDAGFYDYARVVSSTPVYQDVNTPRRDCRNEQVGYESARPRSYGGALLGGLAGAILGNQVGKGSGRKAAIAVGAATGAIVGDHVGNDGDEYHRVRPHYEQRCRVVDHWTHRLTGYKVAYRYRGRVYHAFLPHEPGRSVRVAVNVSLAE